MQIHIYIYTYKHAGAWQNCRRLVTSVLESLRNEERTSTSRFKGHSGLAFNVVESAASTKQGPPARLAKLKKKKTWAKTAEEIAEKPERAEQRRKVSNLKTCLWKLSYDQSLFVSLAFVIGGWAGLLGEDCGSLGQGKVKVSSLQEEQVSQQQQEPLLSAIKRPTLLSWSGSSSCGSRRRTRKSQMGSKSIPEIISPHQYCLHSLREAEQEPVSEVTVVSGSRGM